MSRSEKKARKISVAQIVERESPVSVLGPDYFRLRDFEYVQPLYDLAFLLEVSALSKGSEVPKYRTFSLWRAGYSLDGYGTTIDRWLDGSIEDSALDYVPSSRIREYLRHIRRTGTIPELREYQAERFARCLRLRSVRGLGPSQIALTASPEFLRDEWFNNAAINLSLQRDRISDLYDGKHLGPWQTAHIVPPLLRFFGTIERLLQKSLTWEVSGIADAFEPVTTEIVITAKVDSTELKEGLDAALKREKQFRRNARLKGGDVKIMHQMGWGFTIYPNSEVVGRSVVELMQAFDPLSSNQATDLVSDLHLHTAWSDGSASVNSMAGSVVERGLKYFAVTDHSRSSKLQGGLTPSLWLRQANALTLASPVCPVLHGIEVDILKDGSLDMPRSLLAAADLVVGSVHTNWTDNARENTHRVLKAIESGCIDILAHPTSAIIGKPGVPDYIRPPAEVNWDEVFQKCAVWRVALEMNCFPSRLDLPLALLTKAIQAGCAISFGSDAHARSHLVNLRFGEAALRQLSPGTVLNRLSYNALKKWISDSRTKRNNLSRSSASLVQPEFGFDQVKPEPHPLYAEIQKPQNIPAGSRIVGIDLTAGKKLTGVALLDAFTVETCSLSSDAEILDYVKSKNPKIVSIDSPLGLPGGGDEIDRKAGIVRVAEYDLASVGIPAYPALIDSMKKLTLRGIRLRRAIEAFSHPPQVIESYPGAAQDILCIPRKQKSLDLLREGLRRLGLVGTGLDTHSDDEMDAITSAIVGRYFESGHFEPMGIPSEAQLIVPKIRPLIFQEKPIICLAGKTGAGKSVVARYLSVFYGFEWVRTRDIIRELLLEDISFPKSVRLFQEDVDPLAIREAHLREFGSLILDKYKQVPLREALEARIKQCNAPVVVDSVRDSVDVNRKGCGNAPVLIWFIDCMDSIIRQRLAGKTKSGEQRIKSGSPVDRTAPLIRAEADAIISNSGSLEDLRWHVDDQLFAAVEIRK